MNYQKKSQKGSKKKLKASQSRDSAGHTITNNKPQNLKKQIEIIKEEYMLSD